LIRGIVVIGCRDRTRPEVPLEGERIAVCIISVVKVSSITIHNRGQAVEGIVSVVDRERSTLLEEKRSRRIRLDTEAQRLVEGNREYIT
jgi:hypothetical protein